MGVCLFHTKIKLRIKNNTKEGYDMEFNPGQKEAIVHVDGPCLVLAGPGSGKTATVIKRAEYLIQQCGIQDRHILVVTFTKAAAKEMRQRFEKLTGSNYPGISFGTFHAVFFTILKHAYHYSAANIAREEVKYQFLREIIAKNQITCDDETEFCSEILSEISSLKNRGIAAENYYPMHCGREIFLIIYQEYCRYMNDHRLLDFDDILVYTKELLEQRSDILTAWQQKFRYIMVDEFQDINQLQYQIVRMLAGERENLFVVGDDDQSIYRFRGSKPELMLHFPKDYPKAKLIQLAVNYRCPQDIVRIAGKLIGHNTNRFEKHITGVGKEGVSYACRQFEHTWEEIQAIIKAIRTHISQGGSYRQIAVLYRTNVQPGALIAKLMEYNLPFRTKERIPCLFDHWIAQDIMAYFRFALGARERKDALRIMNRPNRYISRESLESPQVSFAHWQAFYDKQPWIAERIEQLFYDLKVLGRITPYAAVNYIRKSIGYDDFLTEYGQYRQIPAEELLEVLEELQESTRDFKHLQEWLDFTVSYTEQLKKKQEQSQHEDTDSIAIMTLHGAKGLEYDVVFIPDLNEGMIPYKKAVLDAEIEEERRMLYVGMTRAKKKLYLSYVRVMRGKQVQPSCFLKEID